jgi:hypothetical protein
MFCSPDLKFVKGIINHITTERRAGSKHDRAAESRCHIFGPLVVLL